MRLALLLRHNSTRRKAHSPPPHKTASIRSPFALFRLLSGIRDNVEDRKNKNHVIAVELLICYNLNSALFGSEKFDTSDSGSGINVSHRIYRVSIRCLLRSENIENLIS
jgi:hypothetical protein